MLKTIEVKFSFPASRVRKYLPRRFGKCKPNEIAQAVKECIDDHGVENGTYRFIESNDKLCAVCGGKAITKARISINGERKRLLPVCKMDEDAAKEDVSPKRLIQKEDPAFRKVLRDRIRRGLPID